MPAPSDRRTPGAPARYTASVRVRCTPEEHRRILENARRAQRSGSRLLVELGTRPPEHWLLPRPAAEERQRLEALLYELHRLAAILAGIAEPPAAASSAAPAGLLAERLDDTLHTLRQTLAGVREALR